MRKKILVISALFLIFFLGQLGLRSAMQKALLPGERIFQRTGQSLYYFFYSLFGSKAALVENDFLKKENKKIREALVKLRETKNENNLLRRQLNLPLSQVKSLSLQMVDVIGLGDRLLIARDGFNNRPVIAPGNILVGWVEGDRSVRMIIHPASKVEGIIQATRLRALVRGSFELALFMDLPLSQATPGIGQLVITSGEEGKIPAGLIIGIVSSTKKNENQTSQRVFIEPAFKTKELEKVFIITNP